VRSRRLLPGRHLADAAVVRPRTVPSAGPATTAHVNATRRYIVLIARGPSGHVAFAPRLPEIIGRGRGRNGAYRDFKAKLSEHIAGLVDRGVPVPKDDVAAVKFVKVDLSTLASETSLL